METGWKFTREDGTDHKTGTVDYRASIGKELVHPHPDTSSDPCGEGYHLGRTLRGAGEYGRPGAVFRCSYSRKDVLGEDKHKVRVSRLQVIEEVPAWKGYGPRGKQVQAFIDSLGAVKWFAHVGEPYAQPVWAARMDTVDSWAAARARAGAAAEARAAARAAAVAGAEAGAGAAARAGAAAVAVAEARAAAGAAAGAGAAARAAAVAGADVYWTAHYATSEVIGGIKDGYFSRLMEVYRAGHWPVSYDGETLVVW